jgi:hypothetical protein
MVFAGEAAYGFAGFVVERPECFWHFPPTITLSPIRIVQR